MLAIGPLLLDDPGPSGIGFFSRTTFPIEMNGNLDPHSSETAGARKLNFIHKFLRPMAISIPILVLPSGELLIKLRFKVPIDSNGGQKVK